MKGGKCSYRAVKDVPEIVVGYYEAVVISANCRSVLDRCGHGVAGYLSGSTILGVNSLALGHVSAAKSACEGCKISILDHVCVCVW